METRQFNLLADDNFIWWYDTTGQKLWNNHSAFIHFEWSNFKNNQHQNVMYIHESFYCIIHFLISSTLFTILCFVKHQQCNDNVCASQVKRVGNQSVSQEINIFRLLSIVHYYCLLFVDISANYCLLFVDVNPISNPSVDRKLHYVIFNHIYNTQLISIRWICQYFINDKKWQGISENPDTVNTFRSFNILLKFHLTF